MYLTLVLANLSYAFPVCIDLFELEATQVPGAQNDAFKIVQSGFATCIRMCAQGFKNMVQLH
jgi:hypothetical protein